MSPPIEVTFTINPQRRSDLAREAEMGAASFHAGFKALTGSTPIQHINAVRLHESRWMIAMRTAPIAAIATRVGNASATHFSRDFNRHFHRNRSEDGAWMRHHLGDLVTDTLQAGGFSWKPASRNVAGLCPTGSEAKPIKMVSSKLFVAG